MNKQVVNRTENWHVYPIFSQVDEEFLVKNKKEKPERWVTYGKLKYILQRSNDLNCYSQ